MLIFILAYITSSYIILLWINFYTKSKIVLSKYIIYFFKPNFKDSLIQRFITLEWLMKDFIMLRLLLYIVWFILYCIFYLQELNSAMFIWYHVLLVGSMYTCEGCKTLFFILFLKCYCNIAKVILQKIFCNISVTLQCNI